MKPDTYQELSIGERFQAETSLTLVRAAWNALGPRPEKPPLYKTYPDAEIVELPTPNYQGLTLEETLAKRRSVRHYSPKALSRLQLSQLLFAAQGVTQKMSRQLLRTAPSAGAFYPIETYILVNNVEGVEQGIYHYAVRQHALEMLKAGDFKRKIARAGLYQEMTGKANITLILTAIFDRARHKFGDRGFRYVYLEAGHISQNIYLQAVSLGLGSVCIGGFFDQEVNQLIGVDGRQESVIYLHAVGTL